MAGNPIIEIQSLLEQGIALRESDPEQAKDLLSRAERFLEGEQRQECLVHLAIAYYWTGEYAEGLAVIEGVLGDQPSDSIRCRALLAKASLQLPTSPAVALATLGQAEGCCEGAGPAYRGMWHNQRARTYRALTEYDKAAIDYAGAVAIFEEIGDAGGAAMARNNLAFVYLKWGKPEEALEASTQAVESYSSLQDARLPHAQDMQAQILVALGRAEEAKAILDKVIQTVNGDKKELLFECLLTRAAALIQLHSGDGFKDIDRAEEIASYLSRADLRFTALKTRKELAAIFAKRSYIQLVELALEQSGGRVRAAAQKIGVAYQSLGDFIKVHELDRKKPRLKSIIHKK